MGLKLRVLCLSPYHGGSHQQFLEQWAARTRHEFTLVTLPPRHFKWRIRQASVGMADQARKRLAGGEQFDIIWTTSMLDVAELRGLLPSALRGVPLVAYFHENQLVYPVQKEDTRNQHFSLINWASALAADQVWFNSAFNRDSLLDGLSALLKNMPDENSTDSLEQIRERSSIEPLGVAFPPRKEKLSGPLHIGWVGRWEHDKRPDLFFDALRLLKERSVAFRLTVLGQSFRTWPPVFDEARQIFAEEMEHFGYAPSDADYRSALGKCDVVVSTADHEFFGVALLEGVGGGAVPLVPNRLVYPEIYPAACCYSDEDEALVSRLSNLAVQKRDAGTLAPLYDALDLKQLIANFDFDRRAKDLDAALDDAVSKGN